MFAPRGSKAEIESGETFTPKFGSDGLIPVIATDHATGEVLMQAYMNAETLRMTMEKGEAVYWSRSRQEIWHKGATSGMTQKVVEMRTDCDQDCVWIRVEQQGGAACHTGRRSCFYRRLEGGKLAADEDGLVFDPTKVYGK
jgi:phosphoribosyl-AMP cyclohydrolase